MRCAVDVLLLARCIAATQQDHQGRIPDRVINAVALGHVDPQLADPLAHATVVAEIAICRPVKAHRNPRLGLAVPQGFHPAAEGLAHDDRVRHAAECIHLETARQGQADLPFPALAQAGGQSPCR